MKSVHDLADAARRAYPQLRSHIDDAVVLVVEGRVTRTRRLTAVAQVGAAYIQPGRPLTCSCGAVLGRGRDGGPLCVHLIAYQLARQAGRVQLQQRAPASPRRLETNLVAEQAALGHEEQRAWRRYQQSITGRRALMVEWHAHGNRIDAARFIRLDDDDETRAAVADIARTLNEELDRQEAAAAQLREETR